MTPAVEASDRLLDSLGSTVPVPRPNDWKISALLLTWRYRIEAQPMPEWRVA